MTNRIDTKLEQLRSQRKTAVSPFITIGFPDIRTSLSLAQTILDAGADMLELGIPFSDPLADGRMIQKTSFHALQQGANVHVAIDVLTQIRNDNRNVPLIFMGYLNPFMQFGLEQFLSEAATAGLDGLIVADLPAEESGPLKMICNHHGVYLIPLLAPTSPDDRIAQACQDAKGFIYCVSLAGVTGARQELTAGLPDLVARIRRHTKLPILVGFGISRREHVKSVGNIADGVIVASALLEAIDNAPEEQVLAVASDFVKSLRGNKG